MPATGGELVKITSPPFDGEVYTSHFEPRWQPCVGSTLNCTSVVPPPRLVSITVTPSGTALQIGQSRQFTATGGYSNSTTADLTGSVAWESTSPHAATIGAGGMAEAVGVGSTTIRATLGSVSGSTTLSVSKRSQSITFPALPNRALGDPDFRVSATASSGLPVAFDGDGNCSVEDGLVQLTAAGKCTISALQLGNAVFDAAPSVSRTFTIAAKPSKTKPKPKPGPTCKVPKVVGKRLAAAKRALTARHCRPGRVRLAVSATFKKGIVVAQSRRAGKVVPAKTKVNLTVSR
jgi:Bacterial Ig-like domain (group 2)/PASTA domain